MNFFLFIDESGEFDEGLGLRRNPKRSVVGGLCSDFDAARWEQRLRECANAFNAKHGSSLEFPDHFHCGELRAGRIKGAYDRQVREAFAEAVLNGALAHSRFRFLSRNPKDLFVHSRQATYAVNLLAALRDAFGALAIFSEGVDELTIVIARRTIDETVEGSPNQTCHAYMEDLVAHLRLQLVIGSAPGAALGRRLQDAGKLHLKTAGGRDPGVAAADFVCSMLREKPGRDSDCRWSTPDALAFGDYARFHTRAADRLRTARSYAAAAAQLIEHFPFTPQPPAGWDDLLSALQREKDAAVLERDLPALVAQIRSMITGRTREPGLLVAADLLATTLATQARDVLAGNPAPQVAAAWAGMLLDLLAEHCACLNHLGETDRQAEAQRDYDAIWEKFGSLVSRGHFQDADRRLELRNRNLNRLFNQYLFAEVIDDIEDETRERRSSMPEGAIDALLGKMEGSVGQAYAFLAHADSEWTSDARACLRRSAAHFASGTVYHSMATNYLISLEWQAGDLTAACAEFARLPGLAAASEPGALPDRWRRWAVDLAERPFDAVNLLRLVSLAGEQGAPIHPDAVSAAARALAAMSRDAHPHEQIAKWLARLWLLVGDTTHAREELSRGITICDGGGFTFRTIGLTLRGLDDIAAGTDGTTVEAHATNLAAECPGFARHLARLGGPPIFPRLIGRGLDAAAEIARLVPFTYA